MEEQRRMKVNKGTLPVLVGSDDGGRLQRFVIPIADLNHPLFRRLLDQSWEVYGYQTAGPLRLCCSVQDFLHLRWQVESDSTAHRHRHLPAPFSISPR